MRQARRAIRQQQGSAGRAQTKPSWWLAAWIDVADADVQNPEPGASQVQILPPRLEKPWKTRPLCFRVGSQAEILPGPAEGFGRACLVSRTVSPRPFTGNDLLGSPRR